MIEKESGKLPTNIHEQISNLADEFRKQISRGRSPRIEKFLCQISPAGRGNLLSNLLDIEVSFRQRKGEKPTTAEYLKRFPHFKRQVRRAFFEPTMDSDDSANSQAGRELLESAEGTGQEADGLAPTYELPGANRLADYELIRELGRGGMGIVYEARHTKTNNRVALKTLPTGGEGHQVNADKLYRFRKEFRRLSEINHPNLVGMQTLEVDGDRWFFTMDLLDGTDFLDYVRPSDRLDELRLRKSLKQLVEGILELHRNGIVHRDLKPSNVLVSRDGHLSILDFGLASELQKAADHTASLRSTMFAGTPKYAAPEQMFGERTEASDWYAFGTMIYEALTGTVPFSGDLIDLLRQKQEHDPATLSGEVDLPQDLASLTDGLLRREPSSRTSAVEIVEQFQVESETRASGTTGSAGSHDGDDMEPVSVSGEAVILIGREEQLARLGKARKDLFESGKPSVVWVTGRSGEGKSSLVESFLLTIRRLGEMRVFSGRCYDRESVPFKAIDSTIDPLASYLRSKPIGDLNEVISTNTQLLARIFPVLRRVESIAKAPQPDVRGLDTRQLQLRAFDALRDLWKGIGEHFPIILFIDDLQWGDADSAEMLWEILTEASPPPILLIGSFRIDEKDKSSFLKKWDELSGSRPNPIPTSEVPVQRLDHQQCLELIERRTGQDRDQFPPELTRLTIEAEGNPFLLELLVEGFQHHGGKLDQSGLSELLASRLNRLPKSASRLLDAIAVAGKATDSKEIAAAVGLEEEPFAILTHMRSEKLIRLIGVQDDLQVDTYHDKIRESVLAQLEPSQRKSLHLNLAKSIEGSQEGSSTSKGNEPGIETIHPRLFDLAYHYSAANDPRAFEYLLSAGQQALSAHAIDDALEYLEDARLRLSHSVDRSTQCRLYLLLAEANLGGEQVDASRLLFEESLRYADQPLEKARCWHGLGRGLLRKGALVEARESLYEAVRLIGHPAASTTVGKVVRISRSLFVFLMIPKWAVVRRKRIEETEQSRLHVEITKDLIDSLTTDFLAMAAESLDRGARAKFSPLVDYELAGYCAVGEFFGVTGLMRLASRCVASVKKRVSECRSETLHADVTFLLMESLYYLGRLEESEALWRRAMEQLRKVRSYREGHIYHFLRHIESVRGRSVLIIHWAKSEFEFATRTGDSVTIGYGLYGLADGLSRSGNVDGAIRMARRSRARLSNAKSLTQSIADQELGRALLQASRYEEARQVLEEAKAFVDRNLTYSELTLGIYPLFTESFLGAEWHSGGMSKKGKQLRRARRLARATRFFCNKFPTLRPHSNRVSGRVATASGRIKQAAKYFDRAIRSAIAIGAHYEHARALIDKSMLNLSGAEVDRTKGIELLESLGCVLPNAEVEYLNIDRETHYSNSEEARVKCAQEHDIPEFDLAAWEADHGLVSSLRDAE